jgi:hypothetical protein
LKCLNRIISKNVSQNIFQGNGTDREEYMGNSGISLQLQRQVSPAVPTQLA